jgi:hypothetical protein
MRNIENNNASPAVMKLNLIQGIDNKEMNKETLDYYMRHLELGI